MFNILINLKYINKVPVREHTVITAITVNVFLFYVHVSDVSIGKYYYISFMVFLEQTLRLSQDSLSTSNIGQITNFISNDVNRFDRYMIFMPYLFVAPIQLVVVTAVLYYSMGVSSFAGVSILILLAPMQGKGV